MISSTISQAMDAFPMVDPDAPTFDHGDIAEKPRPVPSASNMRDREAVTKAPPITADQETPDEYASFRMEGRNTLSS